MRTSQHLFRRLAGPTCLFLGLLGSVIFAHGEGIVAGGDDIGSMPDAAAQDAPSLLLIGTFADIHATILDVQGPGALYLRPITPDSDTLLLEAEGNLTFELDPLVLASGRVGAWIGTGTTFAGGTATIFAHGKWSKPAEIGLLDLREMPLGLMTDTAAPTVILAESLEDDVFTMTARFNGNSIRITQDVTASDR